MNWRIEEETSSKEIYLPTQANDNGEYTEWDQLRSRPLTRGLAEPTATGGRELASDHGTKTTATNAQLTKTTTFFRCPITTNLVITRRSRKTTAEYDSMALSRLFSVSQPSMLFWVIAPGKLLLTNDIVWTSRHELVYIHPYCLLHRIISTPL